MSVYLLYWKENIYMNTVKKALFTTMNVQIKRHISVAGKMVGSLAKLIIMMLSLIMTCPVVSLGQSLKETKTAVRADRNQVSLEVHYVIYAALDPANEPIASNDKRPAGKVIEAMEQIHLVNTGNASLTHLWLYIYPNSYSSDSTVLCEALLKAGDLRLYFAKPDQLGGVSDLDIISVGAINGKSQHKLAVADPTGTRERLLLTLAEPLGPGDSLNLQTPFSLHLPEKLLDLGYNDGVSYLENWFVQLDPSYKIDQSSVHVILTTGGDQQLYVDGQLQRPTDRVTSGTTQSSSEIVARSESDQLRFDLQVDPRSTIAVKASDNNTSILETGAHPYFDSKSGQIVRPSNDFFQKLLPGPLAAKRPLRPDSVFAQMRAARNGDAPKITKPVNLAFLFNLKEADTKSYLSLSPAIGFNNYDKWMPGLLIHNYGLPVRPFNFVLAPLYSTGDHILSGLGHLSYTKRNASSAWQISLDGSSYAYSAYNSWIDAAGESHEAGKMRLLRIVPAMRYKWSPDPDQPEKQWRLEAKTFILKKDIWKPGEAKIISPTTSIGELDVALNNNRALYPYAVSLQVQGTDQFLRAGLTGNYFLNYDDQGKGLQLRGFAGKFFYLQQKDILSSYNLGNYFFNLSGSNGLQDFTNSDYFVGRSEYQGWMSQQMTTTGGFFKVATPYLTEPIGQTDDWLAAINLTSDLPDGINPFSVLPFKLPVRVFMDLGTYSNLWSENPDAGRFLYDAGLQVSVFKEAVTIYFPLLYSKFYRDTYKSMGDLGTYSKRIRFSISLGKLLPKRLQKDINF